MTHTGPMGEDEGTFGKVKFVTGIKCPKCKEEQIHYQTWDSDDGAFEDVKYTCAGCGYHWWVEGPDA